MATESTKSASLPARPARTPEPSARPRLLDQVRAAIRLRYFSPRTEEAYVHWIKDGKPAVRRRPETDVKHTRLRSCIDVR